jgi:hypothetical protein
MTKSRFNNPAEPRSEPDFKAPATPKNMSPDQAQLYRSLQKIDLGKGQRSGHLQGANRQDKFAERGPQAHPI